MSLPPCQCLAIVLLHSYKSKKWILFLGFFSYKSKKWNFFLGFFQGVNFCVNL
jgi:hypothetical protein